jgi:hypothetical protein
MCVIIRKVFLILVLLILLSYYSHIITYKESDLIAYIKKSYFISTISNCSLLGIESLTSLCYKTALYRSYA